MDYRALLDRQIKRNLSDSVLGNPEVQNFLDDIRNSYLGFAKEKELLNRAYKVVEEELLEMNENLQNEIKNRKETTEFLKQALDKVVQLDGKEDLRDFSSILVNEITSRQKAEDTLSSLIDNLNLGVILRDAKGRIIYHNSVIYRVFGLAYIPGNDGQAVFDGINNIFRQSSRKISSHQAPHISKSISRNEIWELPGGRLIEETEIHYTYSNNQKGRIYTYADVTDKEQANQIVRESEIRNSQILNGFPGSVILIDSCGNIKFISKKTHEVFGKSPTADASEHITDLISDEVFGITATDQSCRTRVKESFVDKSVEVKIPLEDGSEKWIEFRMVKMVELNEASYCCFIMDITSKKTAEQQILFQRRLTDNILNNIPNDIAVFDSNRRFLFVNRNAVKEPNLRSLLIGKDFLEYCRRRGLAPDAVQKRRQAFAELEETGEDVEWLDEYWDDKGAFRYYQRKMHSIKLSEYDNYVIEYGVDVTSNIISQKRLEAMLAETQKINRELELYVYVISHDLQEPLRTISSFLAMIQRQLGDKSGEKLESYMQFTIDAAKQMRLLLTDLLEYARIGRTDETKKEEVDLNIMMGEILTMHSEELEKSEARVRMEALPVVFTIPSLIRLVFQNLIGNALKYRRDSVVPEISVTAADAGTHWEFCVSDNGIGIDPVYFEKIFVIFQRIHKREDYPGTGIGLTIAKKIVEILQGNLWVESSPGVGSRFKFTILKSN